VRDRGALVDPVLRQHRAAAPVVRVLDRHHRGAAVVRVAAAVARGDRVLERALAAAQREGAVGPLRQRVVHDTEELARAALLVHDNVLLVAADDLLAAAAVRRHREQVRHRPGGHKEARLLAQHPR
jgi:uncharacterized protein YgbK (DUF1537 family)